MPGSKCLLNALGENYNFSPKNKKNKIDHYWP